MKRWRQFVICGWLAATAVSCVAADAAILRNGFSITHQRREIVGSNTRLYIDGEPANFVDIPTGEIERYESVPDAPKAAVQSGTPDNIARKFDLNETVQSVSGTYQLDPDLVTSVIRAESGFNVKARSPKGAQGLMQLMPQTATQLGVANALDPEANVEGGTKYLRQLLELYNFDLVKALAAYNAGPQRVEQYHGVPPYYETRAYVARIVRDFNQKKIAARAASAPPVRRKISPANLKHANLSSKPSPPRGTEN